jgi:hypothetical protein
MAIISRAGADRGHEQPAVAGSPFGRAGAREMPHADPGAEQAHQACDDDEQLVIGEGECSRWRHACFSGAESYAPER